MRASIFFYIVSVQNSQLLGSCAITTKAKLSQFKFKELFFDNVVDLVLSGEITITLGIEVKSFARQNTS